MYKNDAIRFFGNKTKVAAAAGVKPASVSVWGELVPEKNAAKLQIVSGGVLVYDPAVYDQHKQTRKEALNHENQPSN
ncbi:transcriptional regulator [Salmonella enterica subsp. enterica]|nr:transcriptional regulator [Salmonella enterica subsp. enterica serovar Durham]EDY6617163.1 transcriptional regulator [Salmonella enterica subsp. enterica serovar Durham]EEG8796123.1 transcriptional regulator [Salmonella enterica subsp. enterica serovar Durham]EEP8355012.1 transcriptional regulator [Salmonella enterica subsp. enterica serovar Durham]EEV4881278.1 transcriptional regulator [Salmonella enterica subsp. enterica serovar Durham]